MLGAVSRLIAAMIPGALFFESLSGRSHRSGWFSEFWIDVLLGEGHCKTEHDWENKVRDLK
jgi:hypothetical protein